ncbi:MAG: insulinase family protein [Bacteroidales bacterium]|nr:insulinase family protein [Bacteroidales bacterium]MBO5853391.1 insulinase family protein [Bacteroidales bacterium]
MFEESVITEYILPNGIKILHKYRAGVVAHLSLMVNTGMRDEAANENGLAHFIEHMLFKGTKKRRAYHVLSCLENVGGELNAYTTKEETCIHASFLKDYYNKAIELISDVAFNSLYPENELEKEKEVILDEINSYLDSPAEEIYDDFENNLYKGHEMGRNILGTRELVEGFSRNDLCNFLKNNYSTDRIVIATIGDIPFEKFKNKIIAHFGDYKRYNTEYHRNRFIQLPTFNVVQERNSHLSHCMIGGLAYPVENEKKMHMVLLNNILGGPGMNSRLNLNIREKYGFAYTIESQYNAYSDTGNFSIYMGVDPHSLDKAVDLVFKELTKLKNIKLGTVQLSNAKNQLVGQLALSGESGLGELLAMTRDAFYKDEIEPLSETIRKIRNLKSEDILDVANEIFDNENLNILIYKGL